MNLSWSDEAWEDYLYWQNHDRKVLKRINSLIKSIMREPFEGIGEPEALRYNWSGYWSRRITKKHRLIYKVQDNSILIIQCRFHY